jgi:hypothetical protein
VTNLKFGKNSRSFLNLLNEIEEEESKNGLGGGGGTLSSTLD